MLDTSPPARDQTRVLGIETLLVAVPSLPASSSLKNFSLSRRSAPMALPNVAHPRYVYVDRYKFCRLLPCCRSYRFYSLSQVCHQITHMGRMPDPSELTDEPVATDRVRVAEACVTRPPIPSISPSSLVGCQPTFHILLPALIAGSPSALA